MLLFALVAAGPVALSAQTDQPAAQTDGAKDKSPDEDAEPGQGKISSFGESLATFWSVSSAFQATQSFDDNVFLANSFRKSDTLTKLSGRITVAYRGKHTRFEVSYLPEFNMYQRYKRLNYAAHNYTQSFRHQFSPRMDLRWDVNLYQAPSRGNLPFKLVNFGGMRFNMYSLEALNDGLTVLNGVNSVALSYKWSPRLQIIATVEGSASHFSSRGVTATPILTDILYSASGNVTFEYSLNARQKVGVTIGEHYIASVAASGAAGLSANQHQQSVRFTFKQKLRNNFAFYASVWPGITERRVSPDPQVKVYFDVGVSRQLDRFGYSVSVQRSTQVGLLQDSITAYGVSARLNRNFGRKGITNFGASYLRSEGATGTHQLESASGNGQVGYRLTQRIIPFINYGYTHQKALIPSPGVRNVNRNEIAIGFVYNFGVIAGSR